MKRNSAANDGEGATSDSPTADVPAPVRKSRWRIARENIEAVLVAVILALIIRHFSLEAFQIPTGSMAPGLNGFHVTTTCPNCGTESDVGIAEENAQRQWQRGPFYESECTGCGAHVQDAQRIGQAAHCSVCGNSEPSNADGFHKDATFLPFTAWCPECGLEYTEIVEPKDVRAGHRILVNKFTYFLRDPHRWEVIVFKFNHQRNYIKRLIGLPGERVQVRRGDVWINGEIVRKPIAVQDNMWFQVHDTDIVERGLKQKPWSPSGKDVWAGREDGGFSFNALDADGGLSYARPILNRYSYNALQQRNYQPAPQDRWARDLRLRAAITVEGGRGFVTLRITNRDDEYLCSIPAGAGTAGAVEIALESSDARRRYQGAVRDAKAAGQEAPPQDYRTVLATTDSLRLLESREYDVDFYLADRQLVLRVDGDVLVQLPLDTEDPLGFGEPVQGTVSIAAHGVAGVARRLRVYRDIHYTTPRDHRDYQYAIATPFEVPEDGYFALGDNSPSSQDGRAWGHLSKDNMLGRALAIFWPAHFWEFDVGFIH